MSHQPSKEAIIADLAAMTGKTGKQVSAIFKKIGNNTVDYHEHVRMVVMCGHTLIGLRIKSEDD